VQLLQRGPLPPAAAAALQQQVNKYYQYYHYYYYHYYWSAVQRYQTTSTGTSTSTSTGTSIVQVIYKSSDSCSGPSLITTTQPAAYVHAFLGRISIGDRRSLISKRFLQGRRIAFVWKCLWWIETMLIWPSTHRALRLFQSLYCRAPIHLGYYCAVLNPHFIFVYEPREICD
jgi:hypothetical protein